MISVTWELTARAWNPIFHPFSHWDQMRTSPWLPCEAALMLERIISFWLQYGGVVLVDIGGKRRRNLAVLQALLSQSWSVLTAVTFCDYQTGWFFTADFKSMWDTLTLFFGCLTRGHALLCKVSSYSLNHFHKYFSKLWSRGDASDKTLNNVLLHLSSPLQPHFFWTKPASWLRPFFETSNSSERCKSLTPYLTARPIGAQLLGCFASESRHRTLKVLSPTSNGDRWE